MSENYFKEFKAGSYVPLIHPEHMPQEDSNAIFGVDCVLSQNRMDWKLSPIDKLKDGDALVRAKCSEDIPAWLLAGVILWLEPITF